MDTENLYYECKTDCLIVDNILKYINKYNKKNTTTWGDYWYWEHTWYPQEYFVEDPFMFSLAKKLRFKVGILKGRPKSCYDWHDDNPARNCTINLLLNPEIDSKCVFSPDRMKKTEEALKTGLLTHKGLPFVGLIDIHELKYKPNKYYLFNTRYDHVVFNFSDQPRYIISLEFQGNKDNLMYEDVLKIIKDIEKED